MGEVSKGNRFKGWDGVGCGEKQKFLDIKYFNLQLQSFQQPLKSPCYVPNSGLGAGVIDI